MNQNEKILVDIYQHPEKLGHLLGYKELGPIHGEWIKYIYGATEDNTLMAHRGSFKTTAISVVGAIWFCFFWPNQRLLVGSSTLDNAKKIINEIKMHYDKEELIALYNLAGIRRIKNKLWWTKESFALLTRSKTYKEGNVECTGVGSVITSRHYDKIICDDIVTLKDRLSHAEREKKKQWVKELQSIIDPKGAISYVGTPWHPQDVYSIAPKAKMYPLGSIPIKSLSKKRIAEIRRIQGESFFSAQYLLEHIPDDDRIFDNPQFAEPKKDDKKKITGRILAYLDPAFGGADFSALTVGVQQGANLFIIYGKMWHGQIDVTYNRVEHLCKEFHVDILFYESNAAQRLIAHELRSRGLAVSGVNNTKNKHLRIVDSVKKNWESIYFSDNVEDEYLRQILDYTETCEHDDAPDSLAGLCGEIFAGQELEAARNIW